MVTTLFTQKNKYKMTPGLSSFICTSWMPVRCYGLFNKTCTLYWVVHNQRNLLHAIHDLSWISNTRQGGPKATSGHILWHHSYYVCCTMPLSSWCESMDGGRQYLAMMDKHGWVGSHPPFLRLHNVLKTLHNVLKEELKINPPWIVD
jgi:hypothetical protein